MEHDASDEVLAAISSDVMMCLVRERFFENLDDVLCPGKDSSERGVCSGDYSLSEAILLASGFEREDLEDVFGVLRSRGGACDCEILYNVAENSRLKSQYWQNRAKGLEDPVKHPHK
jgi:hypothetical protein